MNVRIDKRLECVAGYVRQGAYLADIGTDHAYLPIYLVKKGVIERAVASDVAEGPTSRARANVMLNGMADRIRVLQADGLSGIEGESVSDIAIAGMGAELIAKLLDASSCASVPGVRLILQPMTRREALGEYLCSAGYKTVGESLVRDGHLYHIICAEYDGEVRRASPLELAVGKLNLARRDELVLEYVDGLLRRMRSNLEAKRSSGVDHSFEEQMIREIGEYLG